MYRRTYLANEVYSFLKQKRESKNKPSIGYSTKTETSLEVGISESSKDDMHQHNGIENILSWTIEDTNISTMCIT